MSLLDSIEDGIPVLEHMREPEPVWYTIMRSVGHDLQNSAHYMMDHFTARTDSEADNEMRKRIKDYSPGVYYAIRSPSVDDIATVKAN